MSYGTLVMMDGSYRQPLPPPSAPRNGFVGMDRDPDGAFIPPPPSQRSGGNTFVVELNYTERAYLYGGEKNPIVTDFPVGYKKTFNRLAQGGNPLADATNFIAQFAGCSEARKVRGRAIALSRIHATISGDVFRFPLGGA